MIKEVAIETYKLAKTDIQLIKATLESLNVKKNVENISSNLIHDFNFGVRMEFVDEERRYAYLRTIIDSRSEESGEVHLEIETVHKGVFKSTVLLDEETFNNFVDVQIVPQLLPYARTLISNLTIEMGIKSIILPTMDIINSIMENSESE